MSLAVAPILGVGATSAFASGANLLINGDFETSFHTGEAVQVISPGSTAIDGWAVTSGSVDWISNVYSTWQPESGLYSLDINGNSPGAIAQSFTTVPGTTYSVQFYLGANPGAYSSGSVTLSATVTGGSPTQFTVPVSSSVIWAPKSFTFTASSATTTLTFAGDPNTGASGPALDNVSVTEVAPAIPSAPTIASAAITGTAQVGSILTAVAGAITGTGTTTSYQWQSATAANGTYGNIGSNTSTYVASAADAGNFIKVIITVTNNGGSASQTSAATTVVLNAAPTIASAAITGTAQVGSILTAVPGTITGSGTTTSYQWQSAATANGTYGNIGSNASTYTLVAGDAARFINVIITVTNNGGTQSQTSAATTLVLNGENCKKEGWQVMINSVTNKPFRNQGTCVSYFATRGQVPIGS